VNALANFVSLGLDNHVLLSPISGAALPHRSEFCKHSALGHQLSAHLASAARSNSALTG
jgi:hypothetical protein